MGKKKKAEVLESKTSVKSYQDGIGAEKQKMSGYAKKMGSSVKSLQGEFKKHGKEMREAGRTMIAEGNRNMSAKVGKFTGEIKDQLKENKQVVARMGSGVNRMRSSIKLFLSEIDQVKKDFHAYSQAFWG